MGDLKSELQQIKAKLKDAARMGSPGSAQAPAQNASLAVRYQPAARPQAPRIPLHVGSRSLGDRSGVDSSSGTQQQPSTVSTIRQNGSPKGPLPQASAPQPRIPGVDRTFKTLPRSALTRKQLFRMPEPWVQDGGRTQLLGTGHGDMVDIVIGLDFGTSYTKVAVGFMDKIFPVTWDGVSRCSPELLLPSEFTEMPDGSVFIGQHSGAIESQVVADLKLPFLNPAVSFASIFRASTFVALVLRYVRAWIYRHHGEKIGGRSVRWQLNVGAPSDGLESKRLKDAYTVLAATAWQRSLCSDSTRVAGTSKDLWTNGHPLQDLNGQPSVFPEFVAQMAGYTQSPQRQSGLHSLVDVGGGTLDVVTFIVHKVDGDDAFPFLVPQIHPYGTHGLLQNRIVGVAPDADVGVIDELAPIDAAPTFAVKVGVNEAHVLLRDTLLADAIKSAVSTVFHLTKTRRYQLSDAWRTGVRTFFTGGGAQLPFYRDAVSNAKVPSAQGLLLLPLPLHPRLDGFSGGVDEYQRISVACGLAQDAFSLGRIVPAHEVADDAGPKVRAADRLDRDELYAK